MPKTLALKIVKTEIEFIIKTGNPLLASKLRAYFKNYLVTDNLASREAPPVIQVHCAAHWQLRGGGWDEEVAAFIRQKISRLRQKFPYAGFLPKPCPDYSAADEYDLIRRYSRSGLVQKLCRAYLDREEDLLLFMLPGGLFLYEQTAGRGYLLFKLLGNAAGAVVNTAFLICCQRAAALNGCIAHAAGIAVAGRGYLFLGLSEGGKTTVAKLSAGDQVISDEAVWLDKEGGNYYLYATPFTSAKELAGAAPPNQRYPLDSLYLLEKGNEHRVEPVSKAEFLSKMILHHLHFFRFLRPADAAQTFFLCRDLLARTPCHKLHFAENSGFWQQIKLRS